MKPLRLNVGRRLVIGVPFLWMGLFFLLPFAIVLKISFSEADVAIPPYTEIVHYADQTLQIFLNLGNYIRLTKNRVFQHDFMSAAGLPDGLCHCPCTS